AGQARLLDQVDAHDGVFVEEPPRGSQVRADPAHDPGHVDDDVGPRVAEAPCGLDRIPKVVLGGGGRGEPGRISLLQPLDEEAAEETRSARDQDLLLPPERHGYAPKKYRRPRTKIGVQRWMATSAARIHAAARVDSPAACTATGSSRTGRYGRMNRPKGFEGSRYRSVWVAAQQERIAPATSTRTAARPGRLAMKRAESTGSATSRPTQIQRAAA